MLWYRNIQKFGGKPLGKQPLGRPRRRKWEDNCKMDLTEVVREDARQYWMELSQYSVQCRVLVLAMLNLRVILPEVLCRPVYLCTLLCSYVRMCSYRPMYTAGMQRRN